jgi:Ricin-type beta-trefoil lectin domain
MAAGVAMTGLITAGAVLAGAAVAGASVIGSCSSQGEFAICATNGTAAKPVAITMTVTASPNQVIDGTWSMGCSKGLSAAGSSGSFAAKTPVTRTMTLPFPHPDSCDVTAGAGLANGKGTIHVSISTGAAPPPSAPVIKGFSGKCVTASGTNVELATCQKAAVAQVWAFQRGQLRHGRACAASASGSAVILGKCTSAPSDLWTHKPDGEYVLKARGGKLCLTDPGNSVKNGTKLVVATCKATPGQRWSVP